MLYFEVGDLVKTRCGEFAVITNMENKLSMTYDCIYYNILFYGSGRYAQPPRRFETNSIGSHFCYPYKSLDELIADKNGGNLDIVGNFHSKVKLQIIWH